MVTEKLSVQVNSAMGEIEKLWKKPRQDKMEEIRGIITNLAVQSGLHAFEIEEVKKCQ